MEINIVEATRDHLPSIEALYRDFVMDEYIQSPLFPDELRPVPERTLAVLGILEYFDQPKKTWLVALADDRVVGTVLLQIRKHPFFKDEVGRVDLVMVDRRFRRQGIGSALVQSVRRHALSVGCRWMTLVVLECNDAAHRLYKKCGFENISLEMAQKIVDD